MRFGSAAADQQAAATVARMEDLGLEERAVVEDDDELWMAQRVHQRGACVLKVSGRIGDLPAVCRTGAERRRPRRRSGCSGWRSTPRTSPAARAALAPRACTLLDAPAELRAARVGRRPTRARSR